MRQWLIELLGGFVVDVKVDPLQEETEFLRNLLQAKDKEIARLTNLMLTRAGFMIGEKETTEPHQRPEAINKRMSWVQRQKELEKQDAKRAADETLERWKDKAIPEEQQNAS